MAAHQISLFLSQDIIDHIDRIAASIAKREDREASRSEAVTRLVFAHWKRAMVKQAERQTEKSLAKQRENAYRIA